MSAKSEAVVQGGIGSRKSTVRKTGGWRSFKPVFLDDRCKGCGICVAYCPEGCISLVELAGRKTKAAKVDYDYCKGCLLCVEICPFKGIEKRMEK